MSFLSLEFILFLAVTWLIFCALPQRYRKYLLIVASYVFYGFWSVPFIGVILISTTTDYWLSRAIHKSDDTGFRRRLVILGIGFNLLILGLFKYANFFIETQQALLDSIGLHSALPSHLDIILPLGISFYTFEAISYLVDVYRGQAPASSFLNYNVYIMYFPHLISGPIIRFHELSSQYVKGIPLPSMNQLGRGLEMMILGAVFKRCIADPMGTIVDEHFVTTQYYTLTSWSCLYAALAFTVQLYFDFLGFTQMARGMSLLFNIELPLNFNHPYSAKNVSDFWHRWHISLSRWIRDYLFIPLGGSRVGLPRTLLNVLVVMTLAGLWHGARWNFVFWGFYWGVLLAGYHLLKAIPAWSLKPMLVKYNMGWLHTAISRLLMVWIIITASLFFRSQTFDQLAWMLLTTFDLPSYLSEWSQVSMPYWWMTVSVFLLGGVWGESTFIVMSRVYSSCPLWLRSAIMTLLVVGCTVLLQKPISPFIYSQF